MAFVAGGTKNTVPAFIDHKTWSPGKLPTVGIEYMYDYFMSSHQTTSSASAINVTRLMEITSIIRDSHGLTKEAVTLLKTIGVLNLISTSGNLRASKSVLQFAMNAPIDDAIQELESKSLITYRPYADEYRIWHGTDVDIQATTEILSRHYAKSPLAEMLTAVSPREPILAARHGIKTGTMRMFEQIFLVDNKKTIDVSNHDYDGVVAYMTECERDLPKIITGSRPVILVRPSHSLDTIQEIVSETIAMKEMLETDEKVKNDWVARREVVERIAHNTSVIETKLDYAYGKKSEWWLCWNSIQRRLPRYGGVAVSDASDITYPGTPNVHNEMINRTKLSTQASRARLALINAMVNNYSKEVIGMSGWGPERAMYEALLKKTGLHVRTKKSWRVAVPGPSIRLAWNSVMKSVIRAQHHRINVGEVYADLQSPPIGAKLGIAPVLLIASMIIKNGDVALYEHGTYKPRIALEVIERLLKNPVHFEIKNFSSKTKHKSQLIKIVSAEFKIKNPSLLSIVSLLVNTASKLPTYLKSTKKINNRERLVLHAILNATEPDTLLFTALPNALGMKLSATAPSNKTIVRYASALHKSMLNLEAFYPNLLCSLQKSVFDSTRTKDRKQLAGLASVLLEKTSVDPKMQNLLTAISAVTLDDNDWIEYVAMSLSNKPAKDWDDNDRKTFESNLRELAGKFVRLVTLNFDKTHKFINSTSPTYCITVTNQTGTENVIVTSIDKNHIESTIKIMTKIKKELPDKRDNSQLMMSLIVLLLKKYHNM